MTPPHSGPETKAPGPVHVANADLPPGNGTVIRPHRRCVPPAATRSPHRPAGRRPPRRRVAAASAARSPWRHAGMARGTVGCVATPTVAMLPADRRAPTW